ncbi:MAG: hypothetical protein HFI65_10255, partial [Lachnospiraceae bacterium]|nr:hypothetical protein [Lachnospiraceae bacterium]
MERIAQAQVEERQALQQQTVIPVGPVPDAVAGRALTCGGNGQHSIERIVAFFQKNPTGSAAAPFLEKEFGEGGKGVTIGGKEYALWFSKEGFRIAQGRSAFGPSSTLVSWVNAAVMVSKLLRDGQFAAQEKIDGAADNEYRELAEKLWYLCQDSSESARERNLLPTLSKIYWTKGFPDESQQFAELLKAPDSRQQIARELAEFVGAYDDDPTLLRYRRIHNPQKLLADVVNLFTPREEFHAIEGFTPAKASFITEEEIDQLLLRGGSYEDSKFGIYSYFVQGHNTQECAKFLREAYGEGGFACIGYNESHGSKGIKFTREDDESGFKGYATIQLNWNQAKKRVRALIDSGKYLSFLEKSRLSHYENDQLARRIYWFYRADPNRATPLNPDIDEAVKTIMDMLNADGPEKISGLSQEMTNILAAVSPDSEAYRRMVPVLRDVEAFRRGEYSLFTPLPESALEAERQAKQAAREARKAEWEAQKVEQAQRILQAQREVPKEPEGKLAAAARALGKKMQPQATENDDGQMSFDLFSMPVPVQEEPPAAEPAAPAAEPAAPQAEEESSRAPWWDELNEVRQAHPDSILLNQVGDFFELYGEDAKTAAALLGLTLTTRPIGGVGRVDMCGFPAHALDEYVEKLRASHDVTVVPIDRQPHTMRSLPDGADDAKITVPNYNATVTAEEAPLLERFMADAGISAARFDHENGEVTFSFSAADRDAVENLIAKLRAELTKAVSATYAASIPKKPGRSRPELNYRALAKLSPEVVSGEYRYLHLEAGESMMPLHLEWTGADELSISHTYIHNGDLMRDPEMTFRVDRDKGTLEPLTFQQDGSIQVYQQVYPEPGRWVPKLRSDLNHFAQGWFSNIAQQRYRKREAVVVRDGEDVRLTFDQDGKAVEPAAAPAENSALGDNPTVRQIYEHYTPMVKNLVLADTAYQNACANSDRDLARLEGNEAIKRAVLAINDTLLLKQYYDNSAFHDRIHQEIISETYTVLSQPQPEQAAESGDQSYGPEFMYRRLSVLKSDCEYFLGAGGRNEKHLLEGGSVEKQIAKMRELYDTVPEKPEWLTAEDIDRYEQRMTAPEQGIAWAVSPVTLYRELLEMTDREINRGGWVYEQLRNRINTYDSAKEALDSELYAYVKHVATGYPDMMAAYHTLPKFREWLIEDLMERNYQDVSLDQRDAPDRHSKDADAPEWAKGAPPTPKPQYVRWSAKGPIERQNPAPAVSAAGHSEPGQDGADTPVPPEREAIPGPTGAGAPEQPENDDAIPVEPDFAPMAEQYWELKAQHPDKLVGVQVGEFMMFYGKDAEEASAALGTKALVLDLPGLGQTPATGSRNAWQAVLKKLLEHGHSVVLARPDPERGPDASYEVIQESSAADYIPIGIELMMDGRRMKIESVDYANNEVKLLDLDLKGRFPVFRSAPVPYVRESV